MYTITIWYEGRIVEETVRAASALSARNRVIAANWPAELCDQVLKKCRWNCQIAAA